MFTTGGPSEGAVNHTDASAVCGKKLPTDWGPSRPANNLNLTLPSESNCAQSIGSKWIANVTRWFACIIDTGKQDLVAGNQCQDPCLVTNAIKVMNSPCEQPARDLTVSPINASTHMVVQDCPSGAVQKVKVDDIILTPCEHPTRNLTASPINSNTHLIVQDCPSGAVQKIKVDDLIPDSDCATAPTLPATATVPWETAWIIAYDANCQPVKIPLLALQPPAPVGVGGVGVGGGTSGPGDLGS